MGTDDIYTWILRAYPDESRNYYDILGVKLFENNTERIHNAALLRFSDLNEQKRSTSTPDSSLENMYYELSCAATTLEIPEKKIEYDIKLAKTLGLINAANHDRAAAASQGPIMQLDEKGKKELEKAGKLYQERVIARESHKEMEPIPRPNIIGEIPQKEYPKPHGTPKSKPDESDQKATSLNKCPACGSYMSECAILCIECGYNIVKKDFVITKKLSPSVLPPHCRGRGNVKTSATRDLMIQGILSFKNRLVAGLAYTAVALLVTIATVLISRMVGERSDFIIDAGRKTISSAWKDSFANSRAWRSYFEKMKKSGKKAPFVKAEIKLFFTQDDYGFRQKYYEYSIIELSSGRVIESGRLNVSGGESFHAKIRFEALVVRDAVEKAAVKL